MNTCSIGACDLRVLAKGLCRKHYYGKRWRDVQSGVIPSEPCSVDGCDRATWARKLCMSHYNAKRDSARRLAVRQIQRPCVVCGASLQGRPPNAMYCTIRCKEKAEADRRRDDPITREKIRARYRRTAAARRHRYTAWAYQLSEEQYTSMFEAQGGVCAICQMPPGIRRLAVDHDHVTGRIRGLLCGNCNNGLGRFQDDPERIRRAVTYLTT